MTDRELLEFAAKAAGIDDSVLAYDNDGTAGIWNPLTHDGDALRLAVKLELSLDLFNDVIFVCGSADDVVCEQVEEPAGDDPYAATRRAIVRAADKIGRNIK